VTRQIAINGRFLGQQVSGVQRYARELLTALDRVLARGDSRCPMTVTVWVPPSVKTKMLPAGLQAVRVRQAGCGSGHFWEQAELPKLARGALLVSLTNSAPLAHPHQVVAIHDAAIRECPKDYKWSYKTWYRGLYLALRRTHARFITVSAFSASEISRHFGISEDRLSIIPNAADGFLDLVPDHTILKRYGLLKHAYVLAVGGKAPRKNLELVYRAMAFLKPSLPLVVAGGGRSRAFATSGGTQISESVVLDHVSDAAMKEIYGNALCLVFPSRYEGFGLPPLEAMACGCPVIVSQAASMPEVCGNAALYCHPDRADTIASNIEMIMNSPELRNDLIARGAERVRRFSWDDSARRLLAVLER